MLSRCTSDALIQGTGDGLGQPIADSLSRLAARPLMAVKQTSPTTVQPVLIYEYTPRYDVRFWSEPDIGEQIPHVRLPLRCGTCLASASMSLEWSANAHTPS
jgi:hypothetical protein